MSWQAVRRTLGGWKWRLKKQLWLPDHIRAARGRRMREHFRTLGPSLPPIELCPNGVVELHMLCGQRHLDMALWALWSFLRWVPGNASAYVHSDGTLTAQDEKVLTSVFPGVIVPRNDRGSGAKRDELSRICPTLLQWSAAHLYGPKMVDFHLHGHATHILVLDSDILFFRRPDVLLNHIRACLASNDPNITSCHTGWAYVADEGTLTKRFGVPVPKICAGFLYLPRHGRFDWGFLESLIARFPDNWRGHFWAEQTMYALLAGRKGCVYLPDDYETGAASGSACIVARHYINMGSTRARFFSEGIPRIWADAQQWSASKTPVAPEKT